MRKSISTKLFLITSLFLFVFISFTMYFQTAFFQQFYTNRKMKMLEDNVMKFNALYAHGYMNDQVLYRHMRQFEEANNATVVIINRSGGIKYTGSNQSQSDSSRYDTIHRILIDWTSSPGKFDSIINSKHNQIDIYDSDYGIKNIVCISPIISDEDSADLILAVSSLQPIEEASSVIKEFYIYFFLAAVALAIILSLIYSNMVSKPLVVLNRAASRMADMDFSTKCSVKSDDEIGNLARTLNFLSQNLDTALKDLRDSNIKLLEDIEKERHLDRMRKDFVAGVSHELKTPIALISGYAEGIKDNIADGESRDFYIDVILDEAQKMSSLVSDMLDLSQLESGTFKLKPEVFDLGELMNSVLKKHSAFMAEKNITLRLNLSECTSVIGDTTRIEQVITNFVTNAIRHSANDGFIKVLTQDRETHIYVEIENSGEHIEPEDLKNIWDKFYKVDKSRTRNTGGTGLGLSIVKNILHLHQSTFGVKNTEEGAAFYFTLKKAL